MWTPAQEIAINADCAANLVSAAAGSGKTAVMVERIVSRVLNGKTDIDKLLVVTFTNSAASEMKSRLMNSIMDSLDNTDEPDRLNKQLMLINNADICTIDSFCLNILRNNFYKLDLDPGFKIADSAEIELIKSDVLKEVFEKHYAANDEGFLNLIDCYTSKKDDELFELVLKVFEFTNSMPCGTEELDTMLRKFKDTAWQEYFVSKAHRIFDKAIEYYDTAIEESSFTPEFEKVRTLLLDEKNNYFLAKKAHTWDDIYSSVKTFEFGTLRFPSGTSEEDKLSIKLPRDTAKGYKKELEKIFSAPLCEIEEDMNTAYEYLEKLVEVTKEFACEFASAKAKSAIIDFTDVEHMALRLLQDDSGRQSELAKQLMDKYEEIYVDEYQDCNAVQEKLFSLISRENTGSPNMFMVGDMKQSIYGFRGSQPDLFKDKADSYPPYAAGNSYSKIVLNKNFRSRETIIQAVNHIFSQIMSDKCGDVKYSEEEYLYYNKGSYEEVNSDTKCVDVVLIETESAHEYASVTNSVEDIKKVEAEAIYVANKIKEMMSSEKPYMIYDKPQKKYRPLRYSDICVLLRSGKSKALAFDRILTSAQIPVYCESGDDYFGSAEISFIVAFLKIIDNPFDDVALLSVMRHPVFSFTEDDFVSIRLAKPKGYFYNSIKSYLSQNSNELCIKLNDFLGIMRNFYERSKFLSTDKLIWEIIRDTDYMSYLTFLPNSELKKANVKALMSKAYDFEKTSYKGVFNFIRYIDSLGKNNRDVESARLLTDDEDVVRIMTIHKSKGLEFPVVFLCDAAKQFNENDITRNKVLMHKDGGFGVDYYDVYHRYHYELPQKKMLKDVIRRELVSEEMRILYVALTRPREKLFIVGSERNLYSKLQKLSEKIMCEEFCLSSEVASDVKSYMDWILLSLIRDKTASIYEKGFGYKIRVDSNGIFRISILHKDNMVLNINDEETQRNFSELTSSDNNKVSEILDFSYPYASLSEIPSNMSVTELKRMENSDDVYEFYKSVKLEVPRFYSGTEALSAAEVGTATHLVMEKLDFSSADTAEDICAQIDALISQRFLTERQAKAINVHNIVRILKTDIGKKMKLSSNLKREYSFKYLIDAHEFAQDAKLDEKIVIQGMIDVFFEDENGDIIIADYKTDKISDNISEIKMRYAPQLKYYKIALERALGKKISGSYLLLLDCGEVVEC